MTATPQKPNISPSIQVIPPDVANKYLDAVVEFRAKLIELSSISPEDLTHLPEHQRKVSPESWARQQWSAALVTVSKLVGELDVPPNVRGMIDSLLVRLNDLESNGTIAPEFKSSRGNSGRLSANERHARAYLAAAVWCLTQAGQTQEEAATAVAKLLHDPEKLNRHKGREKQSPAWKRLLRIFEETVQRDRTTAEDVRVDLPLNLYRTSCSNAAKLTARFPQAERAREWNECARGLAAVAEYLLDTSSLPI